jgi:5-methylcytosine-specific restriction endonuclease McrA
MLKKKAKMPKLKKIKKPKKKTVKQLRDACDKLLTPIIIAQFPKCLLCSRPTQVAHHHVHKSQSTALRYELDNLIPLCHSCHLALHMNESYYASKIVMLKGLKWFAGIELRKNQLVKADVLFYQENLDRLQKLSTAKN